MRIADSKQFLSGLLFLVVGALALWAVPRPLGSLSSMGPGYFPMLLGIGLILLGIGGIFLGIRVPATSPSERFPILPTVFVLGGVAAVGLLLTEFGLAVSLLLLVAASCYARLRRHPMELLATYAIVLALTWAIFIYAIQLPIRFL